MPLSMADKFFPGGRTLALPISLAPMYLGTEFGKAADTGGDEFQVFMLTSSLS
jgi:hypothetical protein